MDVPAERSTPPLLPHHLQTIDVFPGCCCLTSRDQLSQALEQRSDGRLHLDPVRGR
jgi:hypothetical protein